MERLAVSDNDRQQGSAEASLKQQPCAYERRLSSMAYEALIVIGFGVALAVVSVALFCAHVKRINAPNKADPGGTLVDINLGAAIALDQAAHDRKLAARGSKDLGYGDAAAYAVPYAGRTLRVGDVGVNGGSSRATSCEARDVVVKDTLPAPSATATMILPSPLWAEAILKHADAQRKKLRGMVKAGEVAAGWEGTWERLPRGRKRKLLEAVREELVHAVSRYVGGNEDLFDVVCPHLNVSALEDEHRGVSGLSRLVRGCLDGKVPEPRSRAFSAVQDALAKAASASLEGASKDKRGAVKAFLPTFRKLCSCSFSIGALEAIASGRAGGTAGPTLASFCTALVKTGGSGILMWAFFHGLQQMSAPEAAIGEAGGLPAAVDGDVGVLP